MPYIRTTATNKIFSLRCRVRGISGGTSAGKTVGILQWLIQRAEEARYGPEVISVVSESLPHLRKGAMRDFLSILKSVEYHYNDAAWEKTNFVYTFPTGSIVEFFGVESWEKVKGARRDILFINEANHLSYEAYTQLEVRTKKIIWLDFNPEGEFWWYSDVVNQTDCDFITLTYKDNGALDERIRQAIEAKRNNTHWWRIYGLGELSELEGKIYTGWQIVDDVPEKARLVNYGLDFGYAEDPAACVAIYYLDSHYILDEIFYRVGMSNRDIALALRGKPKACIVADSAEPKSIAELASYGLPIVPARKGADSVTYGIQYLQGLSIAVTKQSTNVIKEYRNYTWQTDRNGRVLPIPEDALSHSLDATRYALARGYRVGTAQMAGPVQIDPPRKPAEQWTVQSDGSILGPDFLTAFKEQFNQPHSTVAVEWTVRGD